jgi:hypothetical protein
MLRFFPSYTGTSAVIALPQVRAELLSARTMPPIFGMSVQKPKSLRTRSYTHSHQERPTMETAAGTDSSESSKVRTETGCFSFAIVSRSFGALSGFRIVA